MDLALLIKWIILIGDEYVVSMRSYKRLGFTNACSMMQKTIMKMLLLFSNMERDGD